MKKNYVKIAISLGFIQFMFVKAHAQDHAKNLDTVVVTATKSKQKLADIGRVVAYISPEDINRAQGKTLPELLNTIPGIIFSGAQNAPGISSDVYIRGEATGNTLILIDGFPVNNPSATNNSYDLNAFPLDQIDHIEILKGSGSTLYGSDAVAGVINIITKHPKGKGVKAGVQLSGGTYNTFKESAYANGNINKTGIAVNFSNTDSKGFPAATDVTGTNNFKNDAFHQRSISTNLTQLVSEKITLNGNFQTSYNAGDLPQGAFTDDKNYTYHNTFLFAGVGGKLKLDQGELKVNISQNNVWNNYNDVAGTYPYLQNNIGHITNGEAIWNYNLNKYLEITSGLDFKSFNSNQSGTYGTISSKDAHNAIASIYSSLLLKGNIFNLELGGRYNHDNKYGNNFTYTFNPSIYVTKQLKLFTTIASAYKAPTLYQLFSPYGNIGLKPETTTSYEAGLSWDIISNILKFNTAFYQYNTKNIIYFKSLATAPFGIYKNGQSETNKGFESELKLDIHAFSASAYIAYVEGKLTDENSVATNFLIRRPKHTLGLTANYKFSNSFSAGLNYKYVGDRNDTNFDTGATVLLKNYNLLDAHLQYQVNKRLFFFAEVKNIFDVKYSDWLGYNTSRINFIQGLRYQFN